MRKNAAETSGSSPPEHCSSYFRVRAFRKRNPGYMAARMRKLRPNYYSKGAIAQRLRRRTEAAKAGRP
jgi:hypothetical protein